MIIQQSQGNLKSILSGGDLAAARNAAPVQSRGGRARPPQVKTQCVVVLVVVLVQIAIPSVLRTMSAKGSSSITLLLLLRVLLVVVVLSLIHI